MKRQAKRKAISLISGVIAKSKSGQKRDESEELIRARAHAFRHNLNRAFLIARSRIPPQEVSDFFENAARLAQFETNRFSPYAIGHSYLTLLQDAPARPLKYEISWLAQRLKGDAHRLNEFLSQQREIERVILAGEFKDALEIVSRQEDGHGVSLWSTSLRVALLQEIEGDESQKQFAADLRKQFKKAILPVYVRFISQRAEPSVPIGWFIENAKRRFASTPDDSASAFLIHKLTHEWPTSPRDVAEILRVEQNHHVFDMYETFVGAIQQIVVDEKQSTATKSIAGALEKLTSVQDFRLEKVRSQLGASVDVVKCDTFDSAGLDMLLAGQVRKAYTREFKRDRRSSRSIANTLTLGLIQSVGTGSRTLPSRFRTDLEFPIASGMSPGFSSEYESDDSQIAERSKKLAHVFGALPYATGLRALQHSYEASTVEAQFRWLRLAALNSPDISYLDVIANTPIPAVALNYLARLRESESKELARTFLDEARVTRTYLKIA